MTEDGHDCAAAETAGHQPRRRATGRPFTPGDHRINRGGRPRGAIGQNTVSTMIRRNGGTSPLEFLLAVMNDSAWPITARLEAARVALPFTARKIDGSPPTLDEVLAELAR